MNELERSMDQFRQSLCLTDDFEFEFREPVYLAPEPLAVSTWRCDGYADGPRYVVRQAEGVYVPNDWIAEAVSAVPGGVFLAEMAPAPVGWDEDYLLDLYGDDEDDGHAVIPVD